MQISRTDDGYKYTLNEILKTIEMLRERESEDKDSQDSQLEEQSSSTRTSSTRASKIRSRVWNEIQMGRGRGGGQV